MDRRGALELGVGRLEVVNPVDPLVAGDLQRPLKFPESNELKLEEVSSGHPCSLVPVSRVSTCKEARHEGGTIRTRKNYDRKSHPDACLQRGRRDST